ncbi:polysaccharide biosynthesis tyrosine autokinase [Herbivorax sp. ANBcel31]|uniref:polysaccharide biosynthesis tyrosine autokinase n=1 Tax=Herbivorax sp. ANBcel31 TaxID=3069754 RepID=UPI0027B64B19|nr:polysaccharide biosynthesis tyrosine autokinase [Herbivorax sp. ANBcel31]MDQ2085669.1 polysaccharide biosynthesis tyrosine autokinase [Herbivorax sp. ANBcel31]
MQRNEFEEIDLREIMFLLIRKWYLVAICFIFVTVSTFLVTSYYLTPIYRSEATLFLGKESGNVGGLSIGDIQLNNQLIADYRGLLESRSVAERVGDKLDVSPTRLRRNIDVSIVRDSRIFKIAYEDANPDLAMEVVDELSNEIQQLAADIIEVKNVMIIDEASFPTSPVRPNRTMNVAVAGLLGLMLGVGLIILLEYVDHTFKKPEEVEKHLGLNVVGTIPKFRGGKRGKSKSKNRKELEKEYLKNLIVKNDPKAAATEAFRELRTNLHYINIDKEVKTLVLTSPSMGDGKSVTAANLAVTLAKSGKKVLIVDADLRKPKVHHYFGVKNNVGLTNIITDTKDSIKSKAIGNTEISNLEIITSGPVPPNPYEMLSSNKMHSFVDEVKDEYDIVIFDTPPVGQVTDAAILAGLADGTMLVLASAGTRIDMAKRACKALEGVNAHMVGTVLTKIDFKKTSYYGYNYSYKYE